MLSALILNGVLMVKVPKELKKKKKEKKSLNITIQEICRMAMAQLLVVFKKRS